MNLRRYKMQQGKKYEPTDENKKLVKTLAAVGITFEDIAKEPSSHFVFVVTTTESSLGESFTSKYS